MIRDQDHDVKSAEHDQVWARDQEDDIVAEIDVILSHNIENLYLIQYPLRPPWRAYDNSLIQEVRFKPIQHVLEMQYKLPDDELKMQKEETSLVYDANGEPTLDPRKVLSSHVVRSTVVPMKSNYLMGIYSGKELYITPIRGVMQMRPSFSYIDEAEDKLRKKHEEDQIKRHAAECAEMGLTLNTPAITQNEDALKPLQLQVRRKESAKAIAMRMTSHSYLKNLEMEEEFKILEFVHRDRIDALTLFERITTGHIGSVICDAMSGKDYLNAINPPSQGVYDFEQSTEQKLRAGGEDNLMETSIGDYHVSEPKSREMTKLLASRRTVINQTPPVVSLQTIIQLPLQERIFRLMNNTSVIRYSDLLFYAQIGQQVDNENLTQLLIKNLQKFAVLVQGVWVVKSDFSYTGRHALTRNWILAQYSLAYEENPQSCFLQRLDIVKACYMNTSQVKELLDPFSELVPSKGWRLKHAPDQSFISFHLEMHNKYLMWWRKILLHVQTQLAIQQDSSSNQLEYPSQMNIGSHPPIKMKLVALEDVTNILNPDLELSSEGHQELINFFTQCFQKYGVLNPDSLIKLTHQSTYLLPHVDITHLCEDVIRRELSYIASSINDSWFLQTTGNKLVDHYRTMVISLFEKRSSIQRQEIFTTIQAQTGKTIPRNIYNKIMKEIALVSQDSDSWQLKSGSIEGTN